MPKAYFDETKYSSTAWSLFHKAQLYFYTLRYLKPIQIWGRFKFSLLRPSPRLHPAPAIRCSWGRWEVPAARQPSMFAPSQFRFLNELHEIRSAADWNSPLLSKLWLYNLHYFDDLNAKCAAARKDWHRELIVRWVTENPPGMGTGWEPYPLSLRIINWIKWTMAGNALDEAARLSLAIQVRYLSRRLESHLLGNHLFANAKALVFAGCYFEGDEATDWLRLGMKILEREIPEQILPDGGHFERSTMYHALAFEDMLDLANLNNAYPATLARWNTVVASWPTIIGNMGRWLHTMSHPDGEIAFFNDAAAGIAPSPKALFSYAQRLGLPTTNTDGEVIELSSSGYVRIAQGSAVLLVDVAPIGPDYLPGHAHADSLSYELSLFGHRVVVNSGTSQYGLGPKRKWERSTAAHNTVEIDGQNSSEVWAGFRVARRAYPFDISVKRDGEAVIVEAAHDGYRRLGGCPVHRRTWIFRPNRLEVLDIIEGDFSEAVSRVYFHPDIQVINFGTRGVANWQNRKVSWESSVIDSDVTISSWNPEFGLSVPNRCLRLNIPGSTQMAVCRLALDWTAACVQD